MGLMDISHPAPYLVGLLYGQHPQQYRKRHTYTFLLHDESLKQNARSWIDGITQF